MNFEAELGKTVRVVAPMFQRYGGRNSFSGQIVTLKIFEDNSLVREMFAENGEGKVLVIDGGGSLRCALVGDQLAILAKRTVGKAPWFMAASATRATSTRSTSASGP
jgi:regulator of ribonuclease activity A